MDLEVKVKQNLPEVLSEVLVSMLNKGDLVVATGPDGVLGIRHQD